MIKEIKEKIRLYFSDVDPENSPIGDVKFLLEENETLKKKLKIALEQRNLYRNATVIALFNYSQYVADDKKLEEG